MDLELAILNDKIITEKLFSAIKFDQKMSDPFKAKVFYLHESLKYFSFEFEVEFHAVYEKLSKKQMKK